MPSTSQNSLLAAKLTSQDHAFFGTARTGGGGGFHPPFDSSENW